VCSECGSVIKVTNAVKALASSIGTRTEIHKSSTRTSL
jgi:hypothetical protein